MSNVFDTLFKSVWRAYNTDGVPASGAREPAKADIRALGATLDGSLDAQAAALTSGLAGKQAASSKLDALAALTWANKKLFRLTGTNTLDLIDYEDGTWTPTFTFATPGDLAVVYSTQLGAYQRIGNFVLADFRLVCTPTFTTAASVLRMAGMPFVPVNSYTGGLVTDLAQLSAWPSSSTTMFLKTTSGQSYLKLAGIKAAGAVADVSATQVTSASAITISGSLTYRI